MLDAQLRERCQDAALQAAERARLADLIAQMTTEAPWKNHMWSRGALMIAAEVIRRGRHLTEAEKCKNLLEALKEK